MPLKIQPLEVQNRNAKLGVLIVILFLPFFAWVASGNVDRTPRPMLAIIWLGNWTVIGIAVHLVRKRLIRNAQKRDENNGGPV
jgi:hypothetical protein